MKAEAIQWFNSLDNSVQRNLYQSVGSTIKEMYLRRNETDVYILWSDRGLNAYNWFMCLDTKEKIIICKSMDMTMGALTASDLDSIFIYKDVLSWYLGLDDYEMILLTSKNPMLSSGKIKHIQQVYEKEVSGKVKHVPANVVIEEIKNSSTIADSDKATFVDNVKALASSPEEAVARRYSKEIDAASMAFKDFIQTHNGVVEAHMLNEFITNLIKNLGQ